MLIKNLICQVAGVHIFILIINNNSVTTIQHLFVIFFNKANKTIGVSEDKRIINEMLLLDRCSGLADTQRPCYHCRG